MCTRWRKVTVQKKWMNITQDQRNYFGCKEWQSVKKRIDTIMTDFAQEIIDLFLCNPNLDFPNMQ